MSEELLDKAYETSHDFFDMLEKMTQEELDSLKVFMMAVAGEANTMYSYYMGYIDHLYKIRFNQCPTCRVSHEKGDRQAFEERSSTLGAYTDLLSRLSSKKNKDYPQTGNYL